MTEIKSKSFWSKPEGITGMIFLFGIVFGLGYLIYSSLAGILAFATSGTLGTVVSLLVLGLVVFMAIDKNTRTVFSYMFQSLMRWITNIFIKTDPISVIKRYVADLKANLTKMNRQIGQLRGQMHQLKEVIFNNKKAIDSNLSIANQAAQSNNQKQVVLQTRKAGRLQDSNLKLEDLYKKMEVMYRVLAKMYENSEILVEDVQDQVSVKETERKAILASSNAMKSAMSIIKGDPDQKAMFDEAMEAIADDVANKVGEMERFMEVSKNFMQSIDLQNGVFEEKGLEMLEQWEKESNSFLLGGAKIDILSKANDNDDVLDLSEPIKKPIKEGRTNQYDSLFE